MNFLARKPSAFMAFACLALILFLDYKLLVKRLNIFAKLGF